MEQPGEGLRSYQKQETNRSKKSLQVLSTKGSDRGGRKEERRQVPCWHQLAACLRRVSGSGAWNAWGLMLPVMLPVGLTRLQLLSLDIMSECVLRVFKMRPASESVDSVWLGLIQPVNKSESREGRWSSLPAFQLGLSHWQFTVSTILVLLDLISGFGLKLR